MSYGEKGQVGEWIKEKLYYLEKYLPAFTSATKKAKDKYYIDGFAGKGTWDIRKTNERTNGSSLISLNTIPPFTKCFFIEKDVDRVNKLSNICEGSQTDYSIINGDFNEAIEDVLKQIHKSAPTFVFLDPSAAHIKWSSIRLLADWKTELFINFPLHMDLQRNLPNDPTKLKQWQIEKLNECFGDNSWEDIYNRKFSIKGPLFSSIDLLHLYSTGLQEVGYKYILYSDAICNSIGNKLYYMIWAGKHPVGNKIIDSVLKGYGEQKRLFD